MLSYEHVSVSGEHVNVNKCTQANLFKNILLMSMEFFWHMDAILGDVEEYFAMWPWMNNIFGWKRMINKKDELL
jgi:hypothetical protein